MTLYPDDTHIRLATKHQFTGKTQKENTAPFGDSLT